MTNINRVSNVSMCHRLYDIQWHYKSLTSTVPFTAAQATDSNIVPGGSLAHKHRHGFRQQHRLQTSIWLLVVAQMMDISIACCRSREHRLPHSLCWQHGPWTSTWPLTATQTLNIRIAFGIAWIIDINMALRCSRTMYIKTVLTAAETYRCTYSTTVLCSQSHCHTSSVIGATEAPCWEQWHFALQYWLFHVFQ